MGSTTIRNNAEAKGVLDRLAVETGDRPQAILGKALASYEREEQLVSQDPEYVGLAMLMPFDGRLEFTIFKEHETPAAG